MEVKAMLATLKVPRIHCDGCVNTVTNAVRKLPGATGSVILPYFPFPVPGFLWCIITHGAPVAQRIEHQPSKLGVGGSIPSGRAKHEWAGSSHELPEIATQLARWRWWSWRSSGRLSPLMRSIFFFLA